ncbi:MAG: hypothetical protein HC896_01300 [Bacteroidales bacterium]|nr:hypothetical protein [Bacteroidales bacterium]
MSYDRPLIRTAKNIHRADHFACRIKNLTLKIGKGNPKATGIHYYSNNTGSLRDIKIIAEDGKGFAGVDCNQDQNGPCLIKNVE